MSTFVLQRQLLQSLRPLRPWPNLDGVYNQQPFGFFFHFLFPVRKHPAETRGILRHMRPCEDVFCFFFPAFFRSGKRRKKAEASRLDCVAECCAPSDFDLPLASSRIVVLRATSGGHLSTGWLLVVRYSEPHPTGRIRGARPCPVKLLERMRPSVPERVNY